MSQFEVDTLVEVVRRTLGVLLGLEARLVAHHEKEGREAPFEVSAIVGITGRPRGNLVLSFPGSVARRLTACMLGETEPAGVAEQDISDCVGEVANIVAGNLLPALGCDDSGERRISLPSVVVGSHRVVRGRREAPCELLLFETPVGVFAAESSLRETVTTG